MEGNCKSLAFANTTGHGFKSHMITFKIGSDDQRNPSTSVNE